MMRSLNDFLNEAKKRKTQNRVAFAAATDDSSIKVACEAEAQGGAHCILIGNAKAMGALTAREGKSLDQFIYLDEPDTERATACAVEMAASGAADLPVARYGACDLHTRE